jgi:hypothetical protein
MYDQGMDTRDRLIESTRAVAGVPGLLADHIRAGED